MKRKIETNVNVVSSINFTESPNGEQYTTGGRDHINKKPKKESITTLLNIKNITNESVETFINTNDLKNYMTNDPIIDFLEIKEKNKVSQPNIQGGAEPNIQGGAEPNQSCNNSEFTNFLLNQGILFENNVIEHIKKKHEIVKVSDVITEKSILDAIEYMKKGIPILYSVPVVNNKNNTRGIIDLLIRSDYLHLITGENPLKKEEIEKRSPILNKNYHYIVVDIKFSSIPLRSDGIHILNNGFFPVYKAQILIYTEAVGIIQGYTSNYGFILGRKCFYTSKNIKYINNNLGKIDYKTIDSSYKSKTKKAIKWVKNVKENGMKWEIGSKSELFPNMKNHCTKWDFEKKNISNEIGEITSVWNCGIRNRKKAFSHKIKSFYNPKCNSNTLGLKGKKGKIVDNILNINRQEEYIILPEKIKNNFGDWKNKKSNEFFVDFETLIDIFDLSVLYEYVSNNLIFMIGVSWIEDNNIIYKNFVCKEKSENEEIRIIKEFLSFIRKDGEPHIFFWSAEDKFWKNIQKKYSKLDLNFNLEWIDMMKIFISEPIVIKDCLDFKLKNIASCMFKHGLINTKIESDCKNGMSVLINAYNEYNKIDFNIDNNNIIKDIILYNKFDCNVICDILKYLRDYKI